MSTGGLAQPEWSPCTNLLPTTQPSRPGMCWRCPWDTGASPSLPRLQLCCPIAPGDGAGRIRPPAQSQKSCPKLRELRTYLPPYDSHNPCLLLKCLKGGTSIRAVSNLSSKDPKIGFLANFDSLGSKTPGLLAKRPEKDSKNQFTGPDFDNPKSNRGSLVLILRIRYSPNKHTIHTT